MNSKIEQAIELHKNGFNCSQSIFAVFAENYGLPKDQALKISGGFGAGVKNGEICGAVSGAIMVIGLKYGQSENGDMDTKKLCGEKTTDFTTKFRNRNKSLICRDLLGYDVSTPNGLEQFSGDNTRLDKCNTLIATAIDILEELGY